MNYYDSENNLLSIQSEIGKGGEGRVFLLENGEILKIYNENSLSTIKKNKVELLIKKNLQYKGICFPKKLVFNNGNKFVGYTMDKAEGIEIQKSIFHPKLLINKFPNWNRMDLCQISLEILNKINYLHNNGIIMGDINPNNILVTQNKDVFFVDTDSYQVEHYPCPVGTVHFTPPEIQGINFEENLRTIEHEKFAIATLLFMIFLPGKSPYSYQGGGTIKENILSRNFSYPLGDDDNRKVPKGMWEFIWYELPFELRNSFYKTFKVGYRYDVNHWINIISKYKSDLLKGEILEKEILPSDTTKILEGRTLNMNRKNISDKDKKLRIIRTQFTPNPDEKKFAVIELSTKAVKLLFCYDTSQLVKNGFSFDLFYRMGVKTETGKGLDSNNIMDMSFFKKKVIPVIKKMLNVVKKNKIQLIYTVATAAYRTANNREEIIETIRKECKLNVKILSKEEEARATLFAFFFSKPNKLKDKIESSTNFLMIDQGGGSTEITLYDNFTNIKGSYSLNLGTTVLKTILFKEATEHTTIKKALSDVNKLIKERLRTFFNSNNSDFLKNNNIDVTLAVGTAITNATGKRGNKKQHGTILTIDKLKEKISTLEKEIETKYHYVSELYSALEYYQIQDKDKNDRLENKIVMIVGLPMVVEIMRNFNINELIVSGTGLWYGIFFENLYK